MILIYVEADWNNWLFFVAVEKYCSLQKEKLLHSFENGWDVTSTAKMLLYISSYVKSPAAAIAARFSV